jgi:hypothetical protein
MWNRYLFENVLPKAWVKFLCELPLKVPDIQPSDLYKFWPIVKESTLINASSSINTFCKDLLRNVIRFLGVNDRVFRGPSSSNAIGQVAGISRASYKALSSQESKFHWLSLSNGYLEDRRSFVSKIIEVIGFPVISVPPNIVDILEDSIHKDSINFYSSAIVRTYLKGNRTRWEDKISRVDILDLFNYILKDKKYDELVGFKMIPLANGELGTLSKSSSSCVYIGPDDNIKVPVHISDEQNIFKNQLNKFIDKSIDDELYRRLYNGVKDGWNLNIKILNESVIADMIKVSLNSGTNRSLSSVFGDIRKKFINEEIQEIEISNHRDWIYQLWKNFKYRSWDLTKFEDIHLIPTNRSTLRKLKTSGKIFSNKTSKDHSIKSLIPIFEKFGAVFVDNEFDNREISKWDK